MNTVLSPLPSFPPTTKNITNERITESLSSFSSSPLTSTSPHSMDKKSKETKKLAIKFLGRKNKESSFHQAFAIRPDFSFESLPKNQKKQLSTCNTSTSFNVNAYSSNIYRMRPKNKDGTRSSGNGKSENNILQNIVLLIERFYFSISLISFE